MPVFRRGYKQEGKYLKWGGGGGVGSYNQERKGTSKQAVVVQSIIFIVSWCGIEKILEGEL